MITGIMLLNNIKYLTNATLIVENCNGGWLKMVIIIDRITMDRNSISDI